MTFKVDSSVAKQQQNDFCHGELGQLTQ